MSVLGIDTSNYTTSVAVVAGDAVLQDCRTLLSVSKGERGLQQSKALFQHVQNLPVLMEQIDFAHNELRGIAVSAKPRPVQESYMPVFTAGLAVARSLAAALSLPLFETTHQEGHIAAAYYPHGSGDTEPFLAFHISGGTTELVRAEPMGHGFGVSLVGSTLDLHAGQLVDRVGVAMGLAFPAGPALEQLALQAEGTIGATIKIHVTGSSCNLSGAEAAALRLIAAGADHRAVALELLLSLAQAVSAMGQYAAQQQGISTVYFIGGVASNGIIREHVQRELTRSGISVRFAPKGLSSDNAVGVAFLGQQFLR